jgi:hypothetical protein
MNSGWAALVKSDCVWGVLLAVHPVRNSDDADTMAMDLKSFMLLSPCFFFLQVK